MQDSIVTAILIFATALPGSLRASVDVTSSKGRIALDLSGPGWSMWQDVRADWKDDELYPPPVDPANVGSHAPTVGWEGLTRQKAYAVSVPGTVEEYAPPPAQGHALEGVSWWWRTMRIPEHSAGQRIRLQFDAVRHRAEVYLDHQLVGYDLVGNTPFEVDLTAAARPGSEHHLAVRITNPGGGFSSGDVGQIKWGRHLLPSSHGVGGITGHLRLLVTAPIYLDDLYMQNSPVPRHARAIVTIRNTTAVAEERDLHLRVMEKRDPSVEVFNTTVKGLKLFAGSTNITVEINAPQAKLWDLDQPNLYTCAIALFDGARPSPGNPKLTGDTDSRVFGFRWFAPEGIGSNAVLRLNGKRIVLRTAISWGLWPINGVYPTPELAEKQIRTAQSYGLNMLNFHRCIGQPVVLDKADELGLLYFEEPGGYVTGGRDPLAQAIAREKLLRMVKRDRSHPSLVIYNMINEQWDVFGADQDEAVFAVHRDDMRKAHETDPGRTLTYTSAWARKADADEKAKLHMRPLDMRFHQSGWFDQHRAGGPVTWMQALYRSPTNHYGYTANRNEIIYWGEEGAMSAPSRLGLIKAELDKGIRKGFDGDTWLKWHDQVARFLKEKNLGAQFPTVDDFCVALGAASLEHQGRKIELTRLCDANDGYCINGWEDTLDDNHSSVVDCWRNPKADPAIIARYNRPTHIAVESRNLVVPSGSPCTVDFHAINETNLGGPHTLRITVKDPAGRASFLKELPVSLEGGEVYGQLLAQAVQVPCSGHPGLHRIEALLLDTSGAARANGHEEVLDVDWKSAPLPGKGAIYEWGGDVARFLKGRCPTPVPSFDGTQGRLDWLIVARPPFPGPQLIRPESFVDPSGKPGGVRVSFFRGRNSSGTPASTRLDSTINFSCSAGAAPDPGLGADRNYSVLWEGCLIPPSSGTYALVLHASGTGPTRLRLNGKEILTLSSSEPQASAQIELQQGKPARFQLDYANRGAGGSVRLEWAPPTAGEIDPALVIRRAREDGTTVLLVNDADTWMPLLAKTGTLTCDGRLAVGDNWYGGQYFARPHPLLKDLPTGVMTWPYETVLRKGKSRYGLKLHGEELVAGCWQSQPFDLATAVAVAPCGKGRLVISTLDICPNLSAPEGPASVARKLLCNFIQFAGQRE